jgi:hypothetical protein
LAHSSRLGLKRRTGPRANSTFSTDISTLSISRENLALHAEEARAPHRSRRASLRVKGSAGVVGNRWATQHPIRAAKRQSRGTANPPQTRSFGRHPQAKAPSHNPWVGGSSPPRPMPAGPQRGLARARPRRRRAAPTIAIEESPVHGYGVSSPGSAGNSGDP